MADYFEPQLNNQSVAINEQHQSLIRDHFSRGFLKNNEGQTRHSVTVNGGEKKTQHFLEIGEKISENRVFAVHKGIWINQDTGQAELCAIKMLNPFVGEVDRPEALARLEKEAEVFQEYGYPHYDHLVGVKAPLLDVGFNSPVMVMEYLGDNCSMSKFVETASSQEHTQISNEDLGEFLVLIRDYLDFMKENRLIARDLKTGNCGWTKDSDDKNLASRVLVGFDGDAYVRLPEGQETVEVNHFVTSYLYATPELFKAGFEAEAGQTKLSYSHRNNEYQIAVTIYELITGKRAYYAQGNNLSAIQKQIMHPDAFVDINLLSMAMVERGFSIEAFTVKDCLLAIATNNPALVRQSRGVDDQEPLRLEEWLNPLIETFNKPPQNSFDKRKQN